jgi:hypothetical protein
MKALGYGAISAMTWSQNERLDEPAMRLEEQLNTLHNYILALPVRPGPYAPPGQSRRGIWAWNCPLTRA